VGDATVSADPVPEGGRGPLSRQTVSFAVVVSPEGADRLLRLLDLTGLLTIGDALTAEETESLFLLTESENYAGIVAVEKFLSTDLAAYAADPRPADDQLFKAFSSELFLSEFRTLLANTRLQHARELLGGEWGKAFGAQRVWPVQFLERESVGIERLPDGWVRLTLRMAAVSREDVR
jgi:hypothetical protein